MLFRIKVRPEAFPNGLPMSALSGFFASLGLKKEKQLITKVVIQKNQYRDSVFLMVINDRVRAVSGIEEIAVMMGTENNKDILQGVGFGGPPIHSATANDMVICIRGVNEKAIQKALSQIEELLTRKPRPEETEDIFPTLETALRKRPDTHFALISIPGSFAARETKKALHHGLNVLLFSDNVPIEEEVEIKKLARKLNRIVMGPDCGTAIINHIPLAFSNVVNPGPIGIVSASGTGLQEVTCLIDRLGSGISQAIGTGGRDLTDRVGGLSMLKGIDILEEDQNTKVIVLISKPPGRSTTKKILKRVSVCPKKVIITFLGTDPEPLSRIGGIPAKTLEEAAFLAVNSLERKPCHRRRFVPSEAYLKRVVREETLKMFPKQRFIRGLYSGGTLCDEAMVVLRDFIGEVYSNIPLKPEWRIKDLAKGKEHTCIDLGDDYFTKGRPHPMISAEVRNRYIVSEADDPEVAVILLDVVLGYGSHADMAGALNESIKRAKKKAKARGGYLAVVASVCGTLKDPQGFRSQAKKLKETGVVVMPSNAQAARCAALIALKTAGGHEKRMKR